MDSGDDRRAAGILLSFHGLALALLCGAILVYEALQRSVLQDPQWDRYKAVEFDLLLTAAVLAGSLAVWHAGTRLWRPGQTDAPDMRPIVAARLGGAFLLAVIAGATIPELLDQGVRRVMSGAVGHLFLYGPALIGIGLGSAFAARAAARSGGDTGTRPARLGRTLAPGLATLLLLLQLAVHGGFVLLESRASFIGDYAEWAQLPLGVALIAGAAASAGAGLSRALRPDGTLASRLLVAAACLGVGAYLLRIVATVPLAEPFTPLVLVTTGLVVSWALTPIAVAWLVVVERRRQLHPNPVRSTA